MKKAALALTRRPRARRAPDAVAAALLQETSTIGLRRIPVSTERPRRTITVTTAYGPSR